MLFSGVQCSHTAEGTERHVVIPPRLAVVKVCVTQHCYPFKANEWDGTVSGGTHVITIPQTLHLVELFKYTDHPYLFLVL